ncbi:MAG TPA: MFS transporter [Planctomycetota bacterium]|nr:MFS transporter [Planctomycetota bacterium]
MSTPATPSAEPAPTAPATATGANAPITKEARRALMTIFLIVLTDLIGFGMILPLLPFYAKTFNADDRAIGLLFGCFSLFQFLFTPIWGRLSDRIGRRPVLIASLAVSGVMYALYGSADSLWLLFVARIGAGIGTANIGTAQAYISDILPPNKRTVGMGILGAGFGLGFIFGPALGGLLTWRFDPHVPSYAAAGLSGLAMILAMLFLKEAPNRKPARGGLSPFAMLKKYWAVPAVRAGWIIIALDIISLAVMEITLSLWLLEIMDPIPFSKTTFFQSVLNSAQNVVSTMSHGHEVNSDQALTIGLGMALIGIVMAVIQGGMIRRIAPKYGERKMLFTGIWLLGIGLVGVPLVGLMGANYWSLGFVVLLQAIGQSLIQPSNFAMISRNAASDEQGAVLGIGQSISSLMRFIGPVMTGLLVYTHKIETHGAPLVSKYLAYSLPFYVGGVLVLLALIPWKHMTVPPDVPAAAAAPEA